MSLSCETQDHKPTPSPLGNSGMEGMKQGLPSPPLHPKGIQMLGHEERGPETGTETNVDKWSERGILSKDISLSGITPPSLS